MVDALLAARHPEINIRIQNVGTSGNTVRDLVNRWGSDVVALQPDYLSVMIGINDVWRQFDTPAELKLGVEPDEFDATLRQLLEFPISNLKRLILMTPFFIEPSKDDPMRARMDVYGELVKKIASDLGAVLVDTQAAFDKVLQYRPAQSIAADRVHPGHVGHMVLAQAFLSAVEA
jgi:lysophospholipase L1-like esterase